MNLFKSLFLSFLFLSSLSLADVLTNQTGVNRKSTAQASGSACVPGNIAILGDTIMSAFTNQGDVRICQKGLGWRSKILPHCNELSPTTQPTGQSCSSNPDYVCKVRANPPEIWVCGSNGVMQQSGGTGGGSNLDTNSSGVIDLGSETAGSYAAGDAEGGNATGVACIDCITLSSETTGNYVATGGCTASQGLTCSGITGEAAAFSVGLQDCAANEILKRNAGDTAWTCATDNAGSGGSNYALAVDADQDGTNSEITVDDATNTIRFDPNEDGVIDLTYTANGFGSATAGLNFIDSWNSQGSARFQNNITQDSGFSIQTPTIKLSNTFTFYDSGFSNDYFQISSGFDGGLFLTDLGTGTGTFQIGDASNLMNTTFYGSLFMEQPGALEMFEATDPTTETNIGKIYTKDVSTRTELFYRDSSGSVVQITSGGAVLGGGGGAPTSAQYILGTADATLTAEQILTAGTFVDITLAGGDGGAATVLVDATEIGTTTFGSGSDFTWTFNSSGSDPSLIFTANNISFGSNDLDLDGDLEGDGSITFDPDDDGTVESRINTDGSYQVLTASTTPGVAADDGLWLIGDADSDQAIDPSFNDAVYFDSDEDSTSDVTIPHGTQGQVWIERGVQIGSPNATITNAYRIERTTLSSNETVWIDGDADGTVDTNGVDSCIILGSTTQGLDTNCNGTPEKARDYLEFNCAKSNFGSTPSNVNCDLAGASSSLNYYFFPYALVVTSISCDLTAGGTATTFTATVEIGGVDTDLIANMTTTPSTNTMYSDTACTLGCSAGVASQIRVDIDGTSISAGVGDLRCFVGVEW